MADPKQKSVELLPYLNRVLPAWQTPEWLEAERWRRAVRQQPVAIICRDALISYLIATPFEVRARKPSEEDELAEDIEYYSNLVGGTFEWTEDFDTLWDKVWQDGLDLPIGGNVELVRWPAGAGPLVRPHPKGHVHNIVAVDGATLFPTYDRAFPMAQRVQGQMRAPVFFAPGEMARVLLTPRPELKRKGYGMPPPERVFLALNLLYRGDTYYANLLLDTPEAGILDLADFSKESATEWLQSFRELLTGIDPFKVPVLYEHEKQAAFISFTRPPLDLMFDSTTLKYARIMAAGYWLSLSDVGLEPKEGKTLAGQIRDEIRARRSGFGIVKEKTTNLINKEILPPYLEFAFVEKDTEALVQRYRAFMLAGQAMKAAKEARIMSAEERQQQLVKDGLITIEVKPPDEDSEPSAQLPPFGGNGGLQNELDRVPPEQGGRGEITGKAEVDRGDERIASVPKGSPLFDQMAQVWRTAFGEVLTRMGEPQLRKLIKAATRLMFPTAEKAVVALSDVELPAWYGERLSLWFEQPSEFDGLPEVKKATQDVLDELERLLEDDRWWEVPESAAEGLSLVMTLAFSEGATEAARLAQEFLYTEGLAISPDIIGLNFDLKNPATLAELQASAAELVRRVNEGTKYYLRRIITSGVDEGLSSPAIAQMIRDGEDVEAVLKQAGYTEGVIRKAMDEIAAMTDARITSIVNTEIAAAETKGRVGQWTHMGLTRKAWNHTGEWDICAVCLANLERGFVSIEFMYDSVFGEGTITGPPAHPTVCHCHVEFDEKELMAKAGELNVWMGE